MLFNYFNLLHFFAVYFNVLWFIWCQMWWNFDSKLNPYELPLFTPLPNQRFTHNSEINLYGPSPNDVIVNVPK